MLQYIKEHYPGYGNEALYVSLDNIWFTTHSLFELADEFQKMGGKALFLDEVHKYPTWSREIKNIYDSYPDIKIVFTGSSLLEIHKGEADLSRRAVTYHLHGKRNLVYSSVEEVLLSLDFSSVSCAESVR